MHAALGRAAGSAPSARAASGASAGFSGRVAAVAPSPSTARATRTPPTSGQRRSVSQQQQLQRRQPSRFSSRASTEQAAAAAQAAQAAEAAAGTAASGGTAAPSLAALKQELRDAVAGLDRGIFGAPAARRERADQAARALEAVNPTPDPLTTRMDLVSGDWALLYTTIAITGVRKTRLGLREFVKLGKFAQRIDPQRREAVNEIAFSVSGLGAALDGALTVRATYEVVTGGRVAISFAGSELAPSRLEAIFRANYDLLLSIFNPDGWLDVTYVDEELRIGRDDKGHLFVLERERGAAA